MEKRRPELLRLFETQIYGKAPVRSKDLHFRLLNEDREALGGLATRKEVAVYLTKDEKHYLTLNNNSNDIFSYTIDYKGLFPCFSE